MLPFTLLIPCNNSNPSVSLGGFFFLPENILLTPYFLQLNIPKNLETKLYSALLKVIKILNNTFVLLQMLSNSGDILPGDPLKLHMG